MATLTIPSAETILQSFLNNYKAIAVSAGYTNISVDPNSSTYILGSAISQQLAIIYSIMSNAIDARMFDTATGSDLDRLLNQFGLVRKPATSARGFFKFIAVAPSTLVAGMTLVGQNGLQYEVSVSGIYSPNQNVPVNAVSAGQNTDLGTGTILTWSSPPPLAQNSIPVSIALTGGSDLESDSEARARLYITIQNPPNSGNTQALINLGSSIDPIVQSAFVYSNFNGAGTSLIALTGYQSDGYSIGRDIPHLPTDNTNLNSGSSPYNSFSQNFGNNLSDDTSIIYGQLAAGINNPYATYITTVNNIPADVSFSLNLPYPVGSPQNGTGNGWVNFPNQTFPNPDGAFIIGSCKVVSVNSSIKIVIQAASVSNGGNSPIANISQINWVNKSGASNNGWRIVQAKIIAFVDNGDNTWQLTLDTPLVNGGLDFYGNNMVAVNDHIFPASVNAQNYLDTVMGSFANLGAGQVTETLGLLNIGANRQPSTSSLFNPFIGNQFLKNLTSNNNEVFSAEFLSNNNTLPVSSPPSIFIPKQISFYDGSIAK